MNGIKEMPKGIYERIKKPRGWKLSEATKKRQSLAQSKKWKNTEYKQRVGLAISFSKQGSKHHLWKGGRIYDGYGYVIVYSPNHPYKYLNNHYPEHRLMIEKQLGRFLFPGEIVHHKNMIRDDNRIVNLLLLKDKSEHSTLHEILKKAGHVKKCKN